MSNVRFQYENFKGRKLNCYEDAIETTRDFKTVAVHITALGKVRNNTEDEKLIKAIDELISQLQILHSRMKNKSTPVSIEKANIKAANILLTYCNQVIGTQKLEWQIIAERNGWGPK